MGAQPEQDRGNRKYFNIHQNRFTVKCAPEAPKAKSRTVTPKDGSAPREVWEQRFENLSGIIRDVIMEHSEYGKRYIVTMEDGEETMILQIPTDSGYADQFMYRLPNIQFNKPVRLVPYSFTPENETRRKDGINIFQGDKAKEVKIEKYYTKEKPNGMPAMQLANPDKDDWKVHFITVRKYLINSLDILRNAIKAGYDAYSWSPDPAPPDADPADTFDTGHPDPSTDDLPF